MFGRKGTADKLRALQESYLAALPAKLSELEAAARPLFEGGSEDEVFGALTEVRDQSHKLAGSAGTFGCADISAKARTVEDLAEALLGAGQAPMDQQLADLADLLRELGAEAPGEQGQGELPAQGGERPIFILVQGELGTSLSRQLSEQGHAVQLFASAEDVDANPTPPPRAIVVHTAFPRGAEVCRLLTQNAREQSSAAVPVVFLSRTGDLASRLRAVRAGAKDCLIEPLEPAEVMRRIDGLPADEAFKPFRILIVEDDGNLALQCAKAFEGPGYATRIVEDPTTVLDCLRAFDPELIVLDVSLKYCSGLDLARVVWQEADRQDTSIVFLTPGPEFNREILKLGAPDEYFVPRPLDTLSLCAMVTRHLHKVRAGREPPNRVQLLECLVRAATLGTSATGATDKKSAAARKSDTQQVETSLAAPRVLVVDDDEHIVNGIAIKLGAHGIEILKAFNGEQAFEVAWRESPDLIISDYSMPNGSGEYLLSRLKSTAETRHIPVVILTGRRVGSNKDYALERDLCGRLGAVSYLSKPIKFDEMVRELRQFIQFPGAAAATRAGGRSPKR